MSKIAINGFGRIGRAVFKNIIKNHPSLDIVAINDLTEPDILAHLLKYDSLYGIYDKRIKTNNNSILVDGKEVKILSQKDPSDLPWKILGIDIVIECSGHFTDYIGAQKHLSAGAKKVIISAPSKDPDKISSYIIGVNESDFDAQKDHIIDMGSCTTNCLAPIVKVLDENFKIVKGFMTTIHSYTNDQRILDLPHKDLRRARAAAINMIPTSTGATKAIGRVMPHLEGKLDGVSIRVPTPIVSMLDLVCELEKETTKEEVNYSFKMASKKNELSGILGVEDAQLVSSDYIGNSFSAIVDYSFTFAIDNMVKVLAWYDNEWGYATRLAEMAEFISKKIK